MFSLPSLGDMMLRVLNSVFLVVITEAVLRGLESHHHLQNMYAHMALAGPMVGQGGKGKTGET